MKVIKKIASLALMVCFFLPLAQCSKDVRDDSLGAISTEEYSPQEKLTSEHRIVDISEEPEITETNSGVFYPYKDFNSLK